MKTYEETARSVICRAKTHRTVRNRCILGAVAVICVLGIGLGVMRMSNPIADRTENPTIGIQNPQKAEPRLTLLYSDGVETKDMRENITYPCRMEIRTRDLTGLTDDEVHAVIEEEKKYAAKVVESYPDAKGYLSAYTEFKDVLVTSITAGFFLLGMDTDDLAQDISISVNGQIQLQHIRPVDNGLNEFGYPNIRTEYRMSAEEVENNYWTGYGGVSIAWMVNTDWFYEYEGDIIEALNQFHDTLSITVTFRDGTVERHTIEILNDGSGQLSAVYLGATISA